MVRALNRMGGPRLSALLLGIALVALASTAMAEVTARVDRNSLVEGETLALVLQTKDTRQSLEADLSALEGDFVVLDQRSETQMSIINGQQSAVIRKMITLEPIRTGELTIPALEVGGHMTQPIVVNVDAAPEPAPGQPEPVFIEVALTPEDGPYYVHGQIGLTVRLFYQQTLTEAAISQPEPENASVRLLDEVPFQADRGGERYRVLERRYAVFPERSGTLNIPPLVLSGRLVQRGGNRIWQPSSRGRRVTVESRPISVNISPRPANFSGAAWQPARSYRLGEQLSTSGDIRVGEPVTRTVIIDAVGLEENMIAEPDWNEIPDARVYPDQPQGISRDDGEWVLGHKEFRYAVVPEREGSLVLPEIKVVWWDTVANQERTSILPSRTINVLAANIGQPADPVAAQGRENATAAPVADATDRRPMSGGFWPWLTLAFAVLWLATLAWAVARRSQGAVPSRAREHEAREEALRAAFKRACGRNDAAAARLALRAWLKQAAAVSSSARASLVDFAKMCGNDDLARAVRELDAAGFSPQADQAWDGSALYRAWRDWNKKVLIADSKAEPALTDLYARKRAV